MKFLLLKERKNKKKIIWLDLESSPESEELKILSQANFQKYREKYIERISSIYEKRKRHFQTELENYRKRQIQQGRGGRAEMLNTFAERDWKIEEKILEKLKAHADECRKPLSRLTLVGEPINQDIGKIIPQIGLKNFI